MNLSLLLFLIGIFGFVLNRKNIILMLISIEIMLLVITFLINYLNFNDVEDIYVGGIKSSVVVVEILGHLGILVTFYRLRSSIAIEYKECILTIIILPLLSSISSGFFGSKLKPCS